LTSVSSSLSSLPLVHPGFLWKLIEFRSIFEGSNSVHHLCAIKYPSLSVKSINKQTFKPSRMSKIETTQHVAMAENVKLKAIAKKLESIFCGLTKDFLGITSVFMWIWMILWMELTSTVILLLLFVSCKGFLL
jgi:hypothetical protein